MPSTDLRSVQVHAETRENQHNCERLVSTNRASKRCPTCFYSLLSPLHSLLRLPSQTDGRQSRSLALICSAFAKEDNRSTGDGKIKRIGFLEFVASRVRILYSNSQ